MFYNIHTGRLVIRMKDVDMDRKNIDVVVAFANKQIIPLKIRLKDEDGMYQTFAVRAYRDLSTRGCYTLGNGIMVNGIDIISFEIKIQVFNQLKTMRISYHKRENVWRL